MNNPRITSRDFFVLDYTADLTEAGIAYVRNHHFPNPHFQIGQVACESFRQAVAEVAVELAFRRFLVKKKIPHRIPEVTPFTKPGLPNVTIGERRCMLQLSMISQKNRIRTFQKNHEALLTLPAYVSRDQISPDSLQAEDLYIFAILYALVTPSLRTLTRAIQANQPVFLVYTPPVWSGFGRSSSLGRLVITGEINESNPITLEGQDSDRKYQAEQITLKPGTQTITTREYHSLNVLHTQGLPRGTVKVDSGTIKKSLQIQTFEWRNIWVYGMQIILTGYITKGELQKRVLKAGLIHIEPGMDSTAIPLRISDLNSLQNLFDRARSWGQKPSIDQF